MLSTPSRLWNLSRPCRQIAYHLSTFSAAVVHTRGRGGSTFSTCPSPRLCVLVRRVLRPACRRLRVKLKSNLCSMLVFSVCTTNNCRSHINSEINVMSMWSLRWHFTNKSITGAPYSIKIYSYSLSHSQTLWWRVRWLKQCRLEVAAELQQISSVVLYRTG